MKAARYKRRSARAVMVRPVQRHGSNRVVWRFSLSLFRSLNVDPRSTHQEHQAGGEQHDCDITHGGFSHKTHSVSDVFANRAALCGSKSSIPHHYHKGIRLECGGQEPSELLMFEQVSQDRHQ